MFQETYLKESSVKGGIMDAVKGGIMHPDVVHQDARDREDTLQAQLCWAVAPLPTSEKESDTL
jgi:hypothetical protein